MSTTLGLAAGRVALASAHAAWAQAFERERELIRGVVGAHVRGIEHVGSTSVAGVPAKPVLDILVGVDDFEKAAACIGPIERIGYTYRGENGIPRRHYFVKGSPRTHHLHMVETESENWRLTLAFRNLLRSRPESARRYAEAKIRLAALHGRDRVAYQEAKGRIIERMLTAPAARENG